MIQELASLARKHWEEWLPQKTARLKAEGTFTEETQKAAVRAEQEIRNWMQAGAQLHEAREIVLPEYILLKPEADAVESPEERAESAASEKAYQDMMRPIEAPYDTDRARADLEAALNDLGKILLDR